MAFVTPAALGKVLAFDLAFAFAGFGSMAPAICPIAVAVTLRIRLRLRACALLNGLNMRLDCLGGSGQNCEALSYAVVFGEDADMSIPIAAMVSTGNRQVARTAPIDLGAMQNKLLLKKLTITSAAAGGGAEKWCTLERPPKHRF